MDRNMIRSERERLDHQRARIEEILMHRIVSEEMDRTLRRRIDEIDYRLSVLSGTDIMLVGGATIHDTGSAVATG